MAAAMSLGGKDEFQVNLYLYARRIGAEGLKSKVEELLHGLMGEMHEEESGNVSKMSERTWNDQTTTLVGWPRKTLLRDVVLILGKLLTKLR